MSTVVMQQPPHTSPSSELQYGLHHVASHNAGTPLHQGWKGEDDYAQAIQSQSSYTSPGLMQQSSDPYINEPYSDDHQHSYEQDTAGIGLGVGYCGYSNQSEYLSSDQSGYVGSPFFDSLNNVPMTPRSDSSFGPRTRSGRSAARSDSSSVLENKAISKVSKPRAKKARSNKAVNSKTPKLDAPLSELTKHMDKPVRDMVAWVNRSDEERQQEAEKRNGYITRPMNSFMLYRAAYQDRTKDWCAQNNHQVVSSVSGESWPMEPEHVREHYNELAKIERENHARAHPSYKFSPSKTPAASKKKRLGGGSDEDEEDGGTESGDPDWEWRPRNERSVRPRVKRGGRETDYPMNGNVSTMFEVPDYRFDNNANGYSWDPQARTLPYGMDHFDQFNTLYQVQPSLGPTSHPYIPNGFGDNVPAAIPGFSDPGMFASQQQMMEETGHQVDPMLLSLHNHLDHDSNDGHQMDYKPPESTPSEFQEAAGLFGQDMESLDQWSNLT